MMDRRPQPAYITEDGCRVIAGLFLVNPKNEILFLHRPQFDHYESAGGKAETGDCTDSHKPMIEDMKHAALREMHEELGGSITISSMEFLGRKHAVTPTGVLVVAYMFLARFTGTPHIAEPDKFDMIEFIPAQNLHQFRLSPLSREYVRELQSRL